MQSNPIIGQPRVHEAIAHALTSGRMAQSYLFHGPDGVGKRAAALVLAQALLCEKKGRSGEGLACGRCLPCTKAQRGLHPDIHVYVPYPKDASIEDVTERIQILFENPYRLVDFKRRPSLDDAGKTSSKQVIYNVERIAEIMKDLHFVPVEGSYSVGILVDADRMNAPTANKFLKMLEEPPERTIIILTAERSDQMLPTILSRCQHIRFDPLSAADIEQTLVEREQVQPERASFVARMADGSFTNALELLANEELASRRELAFEFIRQSFSKNPDRVMPFVERISKLGREPVKQLLGLMLSWVRDLVLYEAAGEAASLVNVDKTEAIRKFVAGLGDARLDLMVGFIEEATRLVEGNCHVALTLLVLADALADAMRGHNRANLFEPLDSPVMAIA
ncbi:MAG: DNA polymerase III subunit delta' [Bacteroidetes bacterium]|nr:DNA polymerase III subunit delta' [Bacteroidota bacterium]